MLAGLLAKEWITLEDASQALQAYAYCIATNLEKKSLSDPDTFMEEAAIQWLSQEAAEEIAMILAHQRNKTKEQE